MKLFSGSVTLNCRCGWRDGDGMESLSLVWNGRICIIMYIYRIILSNEANPNRSLPSCSMGYVNWFSLLFFHSFFFTPWDKKNQSVSSSFCFFLFCLSTLLKHDINHNIYIRGNLVLLPYFLFLILIAKQFLLPNPKRVWRPLCLGGLVSWLWLIASSTYYHMKCFPFCLPENCNNFNSVRQNP